VPFELINTSAPRGIDSGSRGFTTVAITQGLGGVWRNRLESMSSYFVEDSISNKPIIYTHASLSIGSSTRSVLSRVGLAGLDYSGRQNRIAHHILLDLHERVPSGPASVLQQQGVFCEQWSGDPAILPLKQIPNAPVSPAPCQYWKQITGNAGHAGLLLKHLFSGSEKPLFIISNENVDCLRLFSEAIALLAPTDRWKASFTTLIQQLPSDATCAWQVVMKNTKAAMVTHRPGTNFVDLSSMPPLVQDTYSNSALSGTPIPASSSSLGVLVVPSVIEPRGITKKKTKKEKQKPAKTKQLSTKQQVQQPRSSQPTPNQPVNLEQPLYQPSSDHLAWQPPVQTEQKTSRLPWIVAGAACLLVVILLSIVLPSGGKNDALPVTPTSVASSDTQQPVPETEKKRISEKEQDGLETKKSHQDKNADSPLNSGGNTPDNRDTPNKFTSKPDEKIITQEWGCFVRGKDVLIKGATKINCEELDGHWVENPNSDANTSSNNNSLPVATQQNTSTTSNPDIQEDRTVTKDIHTPLRFELSRPPQQFSRDVYVGEEITIFLSQKTKPKASKYEWSVDGVPVKKNARSKLLKHTFPSSGNFKVTLDILENKKKIVKATPDIRDNKKKIDSKIIESFTVIINVKNPPKYASAGSFDPDTFNKQNWVEQWNKTEFPEPEMELCFIPLDNSGNNELNWKPYRNKDGDVTQWRAEWGEGRPKPTVIVNEEDKTQYVEWQNSVDFIILAKNDKGKWWTLISDTRQEQDSVIVKKNVNKHGTKRIDDSAYKSVQFELEDNIPFGENIDTDTINPDTPVRPFNSRWSSNGNWEKTLDENGEYVLSIEGKHKKKKDKIKWKFTLKKGNKEVNINEFDIGKIKFIDKHGRVSWIIDVKK